MIDSCFETGPTAIRAYLAWVEGEQWVITNNVITNSTREHIVRCGPSNATLPVPQFIYVGFNDFNNLNRAGTDNSDIAKSCLIFQAGRYGWAENNTFRFESGVGPLSDPRFQTAADKALRWKYARFDGNKHGGTFYVDAGAEGVRVEDSTFTLPRMPMMPGNVVEYSMMLIESYDPLFERGVSDVTGSRLIFNSPYKNATLLWLQGSVAKRFEFNEVVFQTGADAWKWPEAPIIMHNGWEEHYVWTKVALPLGMRGWPGNDFIARYGTNKNDTTAYRTAVQFNAQTGVTP
jgi:hypothetical protein